MNWMRSEEPKCCGGHVAQCACTPPSDIASFDCIDQLHITNQGNPAHTTPTYTHTQTSVPLKLFIHNLPNHSIAFHPRPLPSHPTSTSPPASKHILRLNSHTHHTPTPPHFTPPQFSSYRLLVGCLCARELCVGVVSFLLHSP